LTLPPRILYNQLSSRAAAPVVSRAVVLDTTPAFWPVFHPVSGMPEGQMDVIRVILMIIATISGVALIAAVAMQTSKAESFSAAMGGGSGDTSRFRKGSREELLDRLTKYSAIVWISASALYYVAYAISRSG
jgi:protein translocase SecG subunit